MMTTTLKLFVGFHYIGFLLFWFMERSQFETSLRPVSYKQEAYHKAQPF